MEKTDGTKNDKAGLLNEVTKVTEAVIRNRIE